MTDNRWRTAALALVFTLVAGACGGGGGESAKPPPEEPATTSTTVPETTTEPPTTTTIPPTTTAAPTTVAPPTGLAATDAKVALSPTGIVVPIIRKQGDAVVVGTPCGREATMTKGTPLTGTVVLDAGHGGREPGAVGPAGLTEKALNMAVTDYAKAALEAAGHGVVLTRTKDYRISLGARGNIVTALKPRAFVSIHHNAEPDGPRPTPGVETYYQTVGSSAAESKRLAGLIYEEAVKALSPYQGVAWVADNDAGAKYRKSSTGNDYYGIIRRTQGTPGVLAELGFISNPPEEALYAKPEVQKVEGEAVARAIVRFLTTKDPGSGFVEPYPRETPAGGGGGVDNCEDPALE
ncbi:MAG TPA: N-acetylmuramoyl-L-alanine amidase [Acidimicrobiales bacterium]